MQRRPCQVRDGRLQGMEAVVRRQQRMTPECDDRRFFGLVRNRRARLFRTRLEILDRCPLPPLGNRLWIDAGFLAQRRERSLRSLQCSFDGVPSPWFSDRWRTMARSWRSRDGSVPCRFLPFLRKDRTVKPWARTPRPWLTEATIQWFWDAYLPEGTDISYPMISPLNYTQEDLAGLPFALVITDSNDVLRDEGEAFAARLTLAGVETQGTRYEFTAHDFVMLNAYVSHPGRLH